MTVPRGVALVRIRFHSGRTLSVRPLEIDQARAKATGVPFPLGVVLVAFAHHDSVLRVMPERAPGAPGGPLVRSPAL